MKPFSASQLKSYDGCQVRWGYERMEGRRSEQGVNAVRGSAVHAELERWYGRRGFAPYTKNGKNNLLPFLPKSMEACALMSYVGNVDMLVEVPLSFTRKAAWIGFIDGVIFEGDTVYLIDWKTTGSIKYAMDKEQLRDDVAANLYAYEAFEGGAVRVVLRWIYIEFGSQKPRETQIEMVREQVYANVGDYDDRAAYANKLKVAHKRGLLNVLDLKKDTGHCFDYKAECPFMGECNPQADRKPLQLRGRNQMSTSDFAAQVDAVTGGERKAPPAIPGKKSVPALPGKSPVSAAAEHHSAPEPKTESGTFNAPAAGVEPAASPEDAKRIQGIADNAAHEQLSETESKQLVDDLENMDVSQLKALATALGIEFTPKARAGTVKDLIRSKRAAEAADSEDEPGSEFGPVTADQVGNCGAEPGVEVLEKQLETVQEKVAAKKAPKLPTKQAKDADGDPAPSSAGYTLYINCAPVNVGTTSVVDILATMAADFKAATGEDDYRAVEFGKGKGIMANGLIDELQNGKLSGHVTVDTTTNEGFDFCSILVRFANLVIRGR